MFIVISYNQPDDAAILTNKDGATLLFDTVAEAELVAEERCSWHHKVVNLHVKTQDDQELIDAVREKYQSPDINVDDDAEIIPEDGKTTWVQGWLFANRTN